MEMDKKIIDQKDIILQKTLTELKNIEVNNNKLGLYDGLMGGSISFFILHRLTKNQHHQKSANRILNNIQKYIGDVDDFGFARGLSGIGWGIEWLAQNKFIDINTDHILGELDDTLYASVAYTKDTSISLENGTIGKAQYFLYRFLSKNPNKKRYRVICLLECLVMLSDEISENILNNKIGKLEQDYEYVNHSKIEEIAQSLMIFIVLYKNKINTETSINTVKEIITFIEKLLIKLINRKDYKITKDIFTISFAYLNSLKTLEKDSFSRNSAYIIDYLHQHGITHNSNLANFMLFENTSITDLKGKINHRENKFLNLINKINLLYDTDYCYEAFLLKSPNH